MILDSYLYFVRQKGIVEDKDDAIPQIVQLVEGKLQQQQEDEESKKHLEKHSQRWN